MNIDVFVKCKVLKIKRAKYKANTSPITAYSGIL